MATQTEKKSINKGGSFITRCNGANCKSSFQDEKYGPNNRVYNVVKSNDAGQHGRCTVCLRTT